MRILDRYITGEFVKYLLMAVGMFLALFIIVDLFEKLDTFVDHKAAGIDVAAYYLYGIPYTLVLTLPIAMLLATLMVVGQLSRTGELVSILSAGVSYLRVMLPVFILSLCMSVGSFAVAEWVMPTTLSLKDETLNAKIRQRSPRANQRRRHVPYMGLENRLFYIKTVDPARRILRDVVIQQYDEGHNAISRIDAREATFQDPAWLFRTGYIRSGMPEHERVVRFANYWTTLVPERPDDFLRVDPEPMNMSRSELGRYIQRLRESGARTRRYEVNHHLKLAYPLINCIIVILGASLSVKVRRSGWALGIGLSMAIGFAYYVFIRLGQAVGYSGHVPPFVAAWMGNLVFFLVAVGFQMRANR